MGPSKDDGSGIEAFRLLVMHRGLSCMRTPESVRTAYTPTAMLHNATIATGKRYKRGQYHEAAADLRKVVENLRSQIEFVKEQETK